MEKIKINVNKIVGIVMLCGGIIFTLPFFLILADIIPLNIYGNMGIRISYTMLVRTTIWSFNVFAVFLILALIYALVQSLKENIRIYGHILGIVGAFFYLITPNLPDGTTLVVFAIAAILILQQKQNSNKSTEVDAIEKNLHTLLDLQELE